MFVVRCKLQSCVPEAVQLEGADTYSTSIWYIVSGTPTWQERG